MGEAAASLINGCGIDRGVAYIHEFDFAVLTDNKSGSITHAVRTQDAESFRCFAIVEVAEQRKIEL
jgi:hypothetical protein